jgi:hypothetical protein
MLKTQKPLSWFLLAFLAEQGRRYSTDFDGERYWFPAYRQAGWRPNTPSGVMKHHVLRGPELNSHPFVT